MNVDCFHAQLHVVLTTELLWGLMSSAKGELTTPPGSWPAAGRDGEDEDRGSGGL